VGRRGRKRQLDLESEYWKLLQSGVGTVAACKLLGIGRKTGYRWRSENGGLPPGRLAESARSGRYLSRLERQRIATLRERGLTTTAHVRNAVVGQAGASASCVEAANASGPLSAAAGSIHMTCQPWPSRSKKLREYMKP
jgi:hypothetical protein